MARSKQSKRRRQTSRPRAHRWHNGFVDLRGEPLENRLLLSGGDQTPMLDASYGNSPMSFEANMGQVDSQARFISRGEGYELFLTSTGAVLSLPPAAGTTGGAAAASVLSMELVGASPTAAITGLDELIEKSNYLRGSGAGQSITNVPNYARVAYQGVYPGIELEYHGSGKQLEYDFNVAAGADPSAIRLRFTGASGMELDAQGNLLLHTPGGDMVEHAPVLSQGDGANRQAVAGRYSIDDDGTVGFTVGPYDATRPLVIDPVLAYSTYLGKDDLLSTITPGAFGNAIATDGKGDAYITGAAYTTAFPNLAGGTSGALQASFTLGSGYDAFVTELDAAGQIVFSTYLGGKPDESGAHEVLEDERGDPNPNGPYTETVGYQDALTTGYAIAVDASGNVYVTGATDYFNAPDWFKVIGFMPLINPFQPNFGGGGSDGFVAKLNANGTKLVYSSYLGGSQQDVGTGIAVDANENAYILGNTVYVGGSITDSFTPGTFVAKVNADGELDKTFGSSGLKEIGSSGLTYLTGTAIAADAKGNVYFTGETDDAETGTPLAGPYGGADVVVGHLDPDGGILGLVRLGGERDDSANGIALDADDNVYLTGSTKSLHFPTTEHAAQQEKPGNLNYIPSAFVAKIASDLSQLLYCTYLGGSTPVSEVIDIPGGTETVLAIEGDRGLSIAVDATGAAYVVGLTASADFPTANALQPAHADIPEVPLGGGAVPVYDAFVTKLDPSGSNLAYSTYLGGSGQDVAAGIAVDALGNAYVVGATDSSDFRTTHGAAQETFTSKPESREIADSFNEAAVFVVRLAPPLTVVALPIEAFIGQPYINAVATFTTADPSASTDDFTASVNYGDGFTDPNATILRAGGATAPFSVMGNHAYLKLGAYPVVVTVTDKKHHQSATTAYDVSPYLGNQAEPAIAVDPHNPQRLFVLANDQLSINRTGQTDIELGPSEDDTAAPTAGGGVFAAFSSDGGVTWLPSDLRDHTIADGNDGLTLGLGDPNALFDSFGNLFITYLTADAKGVAVAVSIDGGKNFTPVGNTFSEAAGVDQPKLALGPGDSPGTESLWLTYEKESPRTILVAAYRVLGLGAVDQLGDPIPVPGSADGLLSAISVGPKGQVLVSWENTSTDPQLGGRLLVNTNPDGISNRTNFAAQPVVVTEEDLVGTMHPIPPQDRRGVDANPRIVWDLSEGPHAGRVYLSFVSPALVGTNVKLLASDDDGAHWTAFGVNPNGSAHSIQVNDNTSDDYAFEPSITVDVKTGDLAIAWYDTRNDASGKLTQFFAAISSDGGKTFSANVPVNLGASDASIAATGPGQYYDYSALAFDAGWLHPSWADNSFGKSPTTPLDVAAARIAVAHVSAAPPVVVGIPLNLTEGQPFNDQVATFEDHDPTLASTDFTATIDWGDGSDSSHDVDPVITAAADGMYVIRASHTYATPGVYVLGIKVHDKVHDLDGSTATNVSQSPGYQGETTIAIDPMDPMRLFVAANNESGGLFGASSADGGVTWAQYRIATGDDIDLPPADGDAKAVYDQQGNLFLAYLTQGQPHSVVVAVSVDNGGTFKTVDILNDPDSVDQPSIAIGPDKNGQEGAVWVTFQTGNNEIMAAHAPVSGKGLVDLFSELQVAPSPGNAVSRNFGDIAVGPNGQALVAYEAPTIGQGPAGIYVNLDREDTHPESFGPPVLVTMTNVGGFADIPPQNARLVDAEGNLAWDDSDKSSHRGRVYLVYTDSPEVSSADTSVFLRYSDDDGKTWSDRVQVDGDHAGKSQFMPSIAVDPSNGDVAVSWYDARHDAAGVKAEYFVAVSINGGLSFSASAAVSLGASDATDPGLNAAGQGNQFGDYTAVIFQSGIVYPAWTDNSAELGLNPDRPQFEVAAARAPTAHVSDDPLSSEALDISADVNDEGEEFTADLATFTDADPSANPSLYTTSIDWGDKTDPTSGEIRAEGGHFVVSDKHAYEEEGSYTITVTITDTGGASTKTTLDTDVEDGQLTAAGGTIMPAAGLLVHGAVTTFTDSDPNGQPDDYQTSIDWGDGSPTRGQVVFDGTAALTFALNSNALLAIGNSSSSPAQDASPYLVALSLTQSGPPQPLMPLSPGYHGGLAEGPAFDLYAIRSNDAGQSFLDFLDVPNQRTRQVAYLGTDFTGGLAYDQQDGKFYAIASGGALYSIDPQTWTVQQVGGLGALDFSGLAYSSGNTFYATANDIDGGSTLYRVDMGATVELTSLFVLGTGFTGGLAFSHLDPFAPNPFGLAGGLLGISGDGSGSAALNSISTDGVVAPVYEIGAQFNNGFAVIGSHSFAQDGTSPISVHIADVGGSAVTAEVTAQVIDEPPFGLPAPAAVTVFQGYASGPLAIAAFTVPHGAETGSSEYLATIDWGDGSASEPGLVAVSGSTITVSSAGHVYRVAGASAPGAKLGAFHPIVTLTDDTHGSASVTATVYVAPDVSPQVRVVGLGGPTNAATGLVTSTGTITNVGGAVIPGPLYLIVEGLPTGVTLANASGFVFSGQPYYVTNVAQLNQGQTIATVVLQFSDPTLAPFSYHVTVIDGPPGGATLAGVWEQNVSSAPAPPSDRITFGSGFALNEGQTDARVQFLSQGNGYSLFLTPTEAVLSIIEPGDSSSPTQSAAIHMQLVGAKVVGDPVGLDPLGATTNYLIGNDPSRWRSNVPSFGRVEYQEIYPGVTLDYHSSASRRLEYDFTVAAGTDPNVIRLGFQGADSMAVDAAGNLVLHTAAGDAVEQAPVVYQEIGGMRLAVAGAYEIGADGQVGFRLGTYDHSAPLVIDPVLVYSTYLGGSGLDAGTSVAMDAAGNSYVTGYTSSPDFPTLGGLGAAPDRLGHALLESFNHPLLYNGGLVAFVTKFDPSGAVVYSTLLGGSGLEIDVAGLDGITATFATFLGDQAKGIAVDAAGEAYVTGSTYSLDFPTVNALTSEADEAQSQFAFSNGFVSKLSADGSSLLFSTYLTGTEEGSGIALDHDGNAYVVGIPWDNFLVTAGAAQTQNAGGFVEKLSAAGDRVLYATGVPGTGFNGSGTIGGTPRGIAVNAAGEAYVVGDAYGGGGPILDAAQPEYGGGVTDAFIAKLNAAGSALVYWTYLGGSQDDHGNAIAVDAAGNAYVAGSTTSPDFTTVHALQSVFAGSGPGDGDTATGDAFVAKLSADGASLIYSTYLGGSGSDVATAIAADTAGNAYVTGRTASSDFPLAHALQPTFAGGPYFANDDAFVSRLNAAGTVLDYSTYLGGTADDSGNAIAVNSSGDAVVTGVTTSVDFPTLNALQPQAGLLSGVAIQFQPETNTPYLAPAATVGRKNLWTPTAFVTRIAAQGAGVLQLANVPFQPNEGIAFSGIVASFTDTDTGSAGDYAATIDWGDGTLSPGVVTADNANGFGFVVRGNHTYAEEGAYPVTVSVRDADGSVASASQTTFGQSAGGPVTYRVSVDTSALAGTAGFLDLQFNPAALPDAQSAGATINNVQMVGGSLGGATTAGNASGGLGTAAVLGNSAMLNELKQAVTYGTSISFDVRLDGDALSLPARGLFGSTFALLLLAADATTPLDTTAADGAALRLSIYPDGGTRLVASDPHVTAAAVNSVMVADAPLTASLVPIKAVEGTPFAGTVASFTDANPAAIAADFTTTILWADGSAATAGTIVPDGGGQFHVTGEHTYIEAGSFAIRAVVHDRGGNVVSATDSTAHKTLISGLQAPRIAFPSSRPFDGTAFESRPISFATGDFNHDGKPDLAVWHGEPAGSQGEELDVLLGNGDGSFQDPLTLTTQSLNSEPAPIALADFNGDGKLDIATNDMVYLGNGDGTFQAGQPYDGGAPNVALAVADFNGDGKPDLAVVNGYGLSGGNPGVHILLSNGDGTFAPAKVYYDASFSTGGAIVAGDFNGDGKPDIIYSPQGGGETVLFPNNGDGIFGAAVPVASGFTASVAADLNGDAKLDLVGVSGGKVMVLLGKGDGTFSDPIRYNAGEQPADVVVGDFNGDGIPDLAVYDGGQNDIGAGVSLLKGNGDGTFAAPITFPTTGFLSGGGGINQDGFAAADFNGDGSLDVILQTSTTISILFGQGDGTLVDDSFSPSGGPAVYVAAADLNGDGHADVAIGDYPSSGPNVLLGNGDGSFQTAGVYSAALGDPILSGDFNGDGIPDMITGNEFFAGRGDGTYLPAVELQLGGATAAGEADFNHDGKLDFVSTYFDPNLRTTMAVRLMLGNGDGTFRSGASYTASRIGPVAVADMNGDGTADLVLGQDTSLIVLLVNADGSFAAPRITSTPNQYISQIAIGDCNGDGKPDVAALYTGFSPSGDAYYGVNVFLSNGDGSLQNPVSNVDAGFRLQRIALGDFNGDGKLDLITRDGTGATYDTVRILLGNGDGSFGAGVTVPTGVVTGGGSLVTGDFNGDGKLDFAVGSSEEVGILVVLGNGDGTFQPGLGYTGSADDTSVYGVLTADDVNHDGRTDLLVGAGGYDTSGSQTINVFLGQAGGVLLAARTYLKSNLNLQTVDLNGDGRPDLVGIEQTVVPNDPEGAAEKIYVRLNKGDGTFSQFADYDVRRPSEQDQRNRILGLVVGDFNGDGIPDLVADAGGSRAVLLGNGDGTFRAPQITDVSSDSLVEKLLARDVNGDGKLDLIALGQGFSNAYLQVNLGNGDGTFQNPIRTPLPNVNLNQQAQIAAEGFALADFNGDGKLDAVVGNNDRSISVLPGNGDGTFGAPITAAVNLWTTAFAVGDLNGDGKADLVTENVDSTVSLLIGKGDGTFQKPLTYLTDTSLGSYIDYDPLALADLNGDGVLDVIGGAVTRIVAIINHPVVRTQNVADAPLVATAEDHPATQGAPLTGIVARFTDANPLATLDDYSATITWGDGHTSTGVIQSDLDGGFLVLATNNYAQTGIYSATIAITDRDGGAVSVQSTITVTGGADAALTAVSVPVAAMARAPFTGVVATFTDADPAGRAQDFTATITWGDGQTSPGFVRATADGFEVIGAHTFAAAGTYATGITIVDTGGATAAVSGSAVVGPNTDLPLTPTPFTFHATEQTTFSGIVASFTDADPAGQAADYSASIAWGDGTTSSGTISPDPTTPGQFDVIATHGYREAGSYSLTVNILDREGATANAQSTAVVEDAVLTGVARQVAATEGLAFKDVIASFVDSNPFSAASDFTATVAWGDGHVSAGTVTADDLIPGRFDVAGANTYAEEGVFPVDVTIADIGGATASAGSIANVTDAPLVATGATVQAAEGAAFTAVVAAFKDSNPSGSVDDYTAVIVWGDGRTSPGSIAADASGGFDVSGSHSYDVAGTYAARISVLDRDGASAVAYAMADIAGAVMHGTPQAVRATEGALFAGLVASFTSAGASRRAGDFLATIDWGDGQTSAGSIVDNLATGQFEIRGSTTYAEESGSFGDYVTITVADRSGVLATINATASVADATLTAMATTVKETQGQPFTGVLATFTDADPAATAADYSAHISSGDLSLDGIITADATIAGQFDVSGSIAITRLGSSPVTIDILDRGGASVRVQSTIVVSMLPTAAGTSSQAQATVSFNTVVATIEDQNPGEQPGDFTVNIDWSDGQHSHGLVTFDPDNPGVFRVLGSSSYTAAGSYAVTVDLMRSDGLPLTAASTVNVSAAPDALLTPLPGRLIDTPADVPVRRALATFLDADVTSTPADFTATIDWGDGGSSAGIVVANPAAAGIFSILGDHTYAAAGNNLVTISIDDVGGASTTAISTVVVASNETSLVPTNTTLSSNFATGSTYGQTVTFNAKVGATNATPSGSVDFVDQTTGQDLGSVALAIANGTNEASVVVKGLAAGSHTIVASYTSDSSGFQNSQDSFTQVISPATLTVTAENKTKVYGSTNPPLTDTITGFVNGDASSIVSGVASLSTAATAASGVGNYAIVAGPGTLSAANYNFAFANGELTVTLAGNGTGEGTIVAMGEPIQGYEFSPLNNVTVAAFTAGGALPAGDFGAAIDWGDGTTSVGSVNVLAGGAGGTITQRYVVSGSHEYTDEGHHTITVGITQTAGAMGSNTTSATVTAEATIHEELLPDGSVGTPNQDYIQEIYSDLFGREAEPSGLAFWAARLAAGESRSQLAYEMVQLSTPEEFQRNTVDSLYEQYLGRASDASGKSYWAAYLYAGGTIESMSQALVSSAEYFQIHGGGTANGFLTALFQDALGRHIDPGALSSFAKLMSQGATPVEIAGFIFSSDEYHRMRVNALFEQFLDRPADNGALVAFAGELDAGATDQLVISQLLSSDEYFAKCQV